MNGVDKHHAWDLLVAALQRAKLLFSDVERFEAVDSVVTSLIADAKKWRSLQKISTTDTPHAFLLTDEHISALKTLVSTAVWIRSEQLAHPNAVLLVNLTPPTVDVAVEIDTHNVNVFRLRSEFEAGQQLFTLLDVYCEQHAIPEPVWKK